MITKERIEQLLKFKINDIKLYYNAFVHKSAVRDTGCVSNERLEFVGDSVLSLIVANYLYNKYPEENEGFLTRVRTKIVSGSNLANISLKLGLHNYVLMNEKAMNNEWNTNPRILEDVLESLIGSIFLDLGLEKSKEFVLRIIDETMNEETILKDTNYKDILMKFAQSKGLTSPAYLLKTENGPDHNKIFTIQVTIDGKVIGEGFEKNKKKSEQQAARRALRSFGVE